MTNQQMNNVIDFILTNQERINEMDNSDKVKFIANANHTNTQVSGCMLHLAELQQETDD